MRADNRSAFSVLEAIIVLTFVAVIAAIAVPRINFAAISRQRAECAARRIVTDLRRTRRFAISSAAVNPHGFSLIVLGSSPLRYDVRTLDGGATLESHTFDSQVSCTGGTSFAFGPLGNLLDGSDSGLAISAEGKTFTITIIPATGAIRCVEN
jgi:type II secretory pathway pseudopilin PulG